MGAASPFISACAGYSGGICVYKASVCTCAHRAEEQGQVLVQLSSCNGLVRPFVPNRVSNDVCSACCAFAPLYLSATAQ